MLFLIKIKLKLKLPFSIFSVQHVSLIAVSQIIVAHCTDVSVWVFIDGWRNLSKAKKTLLVIDGTPI